MAWLTALIVASSAARSSVSASFVEQDHQVVTMAPTPQLARLPIRCSSLAYDGPDRFMTDPEFGR
jgi:hypothetical protein